MELLRKAQPGIGLRGCGRPKSIIEEPAPTTHHLTDLDDAVPPVTMTFREPGTHHVVLEGEELRPATLRYGELTAYSMDEISTLKDTEFAFGMKVHSYVGRVRPGTAVREGPGVYNYGSGDSFEGRWRNGVRHGPGMLVLASAYVMEGDWRDDKPHGKNIRETLPRGEVYYGHFAAGKPHGQGAMYYADNGSRFEGNWENGEKHGDGVVFYANGDTFQGKWSNGKREGKGITTYASTGRSYQTQWHRDECSLRTTFVPADEVPPLKASFPPLEQLPVSSLGTDLRKMSVSSEAVVDMCRQQFLRLKAAFEELDVAFTGELSLPHLASVWGDENRSLFTKLERAATTTQSVASGHSGSHSSPTPTLSFTDLLTVLFPTLAPQDVKRWMTVDFAPETLLRLRGSLAEVSSPKADGFLQAAASGELSLTDLQRFKSVIGGVRVSERIFPRNKAITDKDTMNFREFITQVYPMVHPAMVVRIQATVVPHHALMTYWTCFESLDAADRSGYVSLEKLKAAQKRWQAMCGNGVLFHPNPGNPYETLLRRGAWKHLCVWPLADIPLSVALVKAVDSKARSGYVSLLEVLRYCFPNVPCVATRDRLGAAVRADDACRCCLCAFCGPRHSKPRPPNPYLDGMVTW